MNQGKISALFKSLISSSKITVLTNGLDLKLSTKIVWLLHMNLTLIIIFSSLATSTFLYQSYTLPKGIRSLIYIFPSF
jgi:hypothetical protein